MQTNYISCFKYYKQDHYIYVYTVETCYKNILAGNVSIRPYIDFTSYKNIPVLKTCFSTPDDVLMTGFHCIIKTRLCLCIHRGILSKR